MVFLYESQTYPPELILKLSNILDYILYQAKQTKVILKDEIAHIKEYLELEKIRFQDTLQVHFRYSENYEQIEFIRANRKMVKIDFSDIEFIESLSDYIKIHLSEKTVITRETITNIEAKLPKKDFIRTHRSFIVSFHKISSFTNEFIEINNNEIPISRSFKAEVLSKLERMGQLKI